MPPGCCALKRTERDLYVYMIRQLSAKGDFILLVLEEEIRAQREPSVKQRVLGIEAKIRRESTIREEAWG